MARLCPELDLDLDLDLEWDLEWDIELDNIASRLLCWWQGGDFHNILDSRVSLKNSKNQIILSNSQGRAVLHPVKSLLTAKIAVQPLSVCVYVALKVELHIRVKYLNPSFTEFFLSKLETLLYINFCCQPLLYSYVLLYNTMYRCTVYIQALSCLLYLCTCILYTYWLFHACFTSLCICVLCTGIL